LEGRGAPASVTRRTRLCLSVSVVLRSLPIDPLLPDITGALRAGNRLVLRAPPGAGKTTRVPAALLDAGLAGDRQILVLEPRRIAARAAAEFVAAERGGRVGDEVGYRVRFEQRGGAATRLWFLTEGVLGRQLGRDPFLEETAIVVLDEFHERHLQGDVALAVVRELQETVRPDLKLLVMSATLETTALAGYLGGCTVLTSEGRSYPVQIEYSAAPDDRPLAGRVAGALRRVLAEAADRGDVLVFLPGAAEIRRAADAVAPLAAEHDLLILPLHGDLPLEAQQRVLRRAARRKVVLATNVAETSLTIDGVTAVIDSGLARVARYDPRHGVNTLRLAAISRAAAEQRAGRAGRTAPGRCLRLWTAGEHAARLEREAPEIHRLELSGMLLELRAWGQRDGHAVAWLDAPRPAALARAERLLALLGAVDAASGMPTDLGRHLLAVPAAPRLARLLLEAERRGVGARGALLAALASERDICLDARTFGGEHPRQRPTGPSDLLLRAELFEDAARDGFDTGALRRRGLDPGAVRAVDRARRQLTSPRLVAAPPGGRRAVTAGERGGGKDRAPEAEILRCILAGFPDRVVRRRAPGSARGVMVGGTGVVLDPQSVVRDAELFVAVEVDGGARRETEPRVRVASAVERDWLARMFPQALRTVEGLEFDHEHERVVRRTRELFHDLVLSERTHVEVDRAAAGALLADAARRDPVHAAGLGDGERAFLARLRFLQPWMPELDLPADVDAFLGDTVAALCDGKRSFTELRRADLLGALRGQLSRRQVRALERGAPAHFTLPTGRSVPIVYAPDRPPAFAARIQEVFGLRATPRLAAGRVPLVIQLLAPNQRPVQITDDLESFWRTTYPEVRRELRGRYPKHAWPEDPINATPTSKRKR
jgi:ATP-dependent RNA helicase HrpB